MSGQTFDTIDRVRLEVEQATPAGQLVNLIQNPNGDLGGWGWITPVANTAMITDTAAAGRLRFYTTVAQACYFTTELLHAAAGQYVGARINLIAGSGLAWARGRFVFLNAAGGVISSGAQTAYTSVTNTVLQVPAMVAPAGTAYVQLRVDLYASNIGANPVANAYLIHNQSVLAVANTSAGLGSVRTNLFAQPSGEGATTLFQPYYGNTTVSGGWTAADGAPIWNRNRCVRVEPTVANVPIGVAVAVNAESGRDYACQMRIAAWHLTAPRTIVLAARGMTAGGAPITALVPLQTIVLNPGAGYTLFSGVYNLPAAAAAIQLVAYTNGNVPLGELLAVDGVMIEQASAVGTYFDGATPDAGGVDYAWSGTADNSASTATVAGSLAFIPPATFLSILGTANQLVVDRAPLDVGTLTGGMKDATLDPSQSDVLRPGRAVRLSVYDPAATTWTALFTGVLRDADVSYDLRAKNPAKRAVITLVATDHTTELANARQSDGVGSIAHVPHVLEGAGVPWSVNGSGNQVPAAVVVAQNDNASVLDQIVIARDSALGHAWVDRRNVLIVNDEAHMPAAVWAYLDEATYTDLQLDYDTDRCINNVTVKFLRTDPGTGETQEVLYGPYVDQASVDEWGTHAATFTIQWATESGSAIATFAQSILTANAQPDRRVNSLTLPIRTDADLTTAGERRALLDLGDLVQVVNTDAGVNSELRIEGIRHTITAKRWSVDLEFVRDGQVAAPISTPAPPDGAGGLTLSQLLRPVGEVTMLYGTAAQVPAGWLELNGAAYSTTTYPALAAWLAIADPALPAGILPNMQDRFPVGASAGKPMGTAGGSATLPNHTHPITAATTAGTSVPNSGTGSQLVTGKGAFDGHNHGGNTGNPGSNPDQQPPWRAIRYIIRAR